MKIVKDVADVLSFVHSEQLAHKNVKSTSVLIDVSFRAVVQGDFGFVLSSTESRRFEAAMSKRLMCLNSAFLCWKLFLGEEGWILRCGKKRGIWWTLRGECMRLMRNREVTYISIVKSN